MDMQVVHEMYPVETSPDRHPREKRERASSREENPLPPKSTIEGMERKKERKEKTNWVLGPSLLNRGLQTL
jgi:hypothetical protein